MTRLTPEREEEIEESIVEGIGGDIIDELWREIRALRAELKISDHMEQLHTEISKANIVLLVQRDAALSRVEKLREALSISRAQWIHSVNAKQCLEALADELEAMPEEK